MPIPNKLSPAHYSLLYFVKGGRPNVFTPDRVPILACKRCGQEQKDYGGYKNKMNPGGVNLRDVWADIPPVRHSKYKNRDANQLHIKLLDRVIELASKPGDIVLDPFGGSGTTYAVAELKGRRWIGIELGEVEPIVERLKNVEQERPILEALRAAQNVLFTDKTLRNRIKNKMVTGQQN